MDATDTGLLGIRYYGCWIDDLYNEIRPHQSLPERMTPDEAYFGPLSMKAAA